MTEAVRPGVVMKCRFVISSSDIFSNYIRYMDRKEAVEGGEIRQEYSSYVETYMGNPEKTGGLFTDIQDRISRETAEQMRSCFVSAQKRGSPMWQTVISFDNEWLSEQGVYDQENQVLDEAKIKEASRKSLRRMLEKEGMQHAVWTGAIHYNTDNIHVHVAVVDYMGERPKITEGRYAGQVRGKWKPKTLWYGKSAVVNSLMDMSRENELLNHLIRDCIVEPLKERELWKQPKYAGTAWGLMEQLRKEVPDLRKWNYGSGEMEPYCKRIDTVTEQFIQKEHREDWEELQELLKQMEEKHRRAYGMSVSGKQYREDKIQDLYRRCGNAILHTMKEEEKERRRENGKGRKKTDGERVRTGYSSRIRRFCSALEDSLKKEYRHIKNQLAFEQLQREERENEYEAGSQTDLGMY